MSSNWWMDIQNDVYLYRGIFDNKNEQSSNTCYNVDNVENKLTERSSHKRLWIMSSVYMKCPEMVNL